MKLYNTLSRKIEEFRPLNPPQVGIYICGPTVYDKTHVGHLRTYTNSDVLNRVLNFNGFKPKVVMNVTDVGHLVSDQDFGEDKIEKAAKREKKSAWEIAKIYEKQFWQDLQQLNIKKPDIICHATDHIEAMINLIKRLESKGFTYRIDDGIYFDTSKDRHYGELAGIKEQEQLAGARVAVIAGKKQPRDFALWKFSPNPPAGGQKREMEWDSPWGKGFPGWHIECSSMSMKYLGEQFDLHTGGVDHIGTHHPNEIAQSENATGKRPFVKYWFHSEHLLVDGERMAKSKHNFYTLEFLEEKGFLPLSLRFLFLNCHYRDPLNFTFPSLEASQNGYQRLKEQIKTLKETKEEIRTEAMKNWQEKFKAAINDDLGLPEALSVSFQMLKDKNLNGSEKYRLILKFDQVFGLSLGETKEIKIPEEIKVLAKEREKLRKEKQWEKADQIRQKINQLGWLVEDCNQGVKIRKVG